MRISSPIEISNLDSDDPQFVSFLSQLINSIITVINGEISFLDNFKARIVSVTFNTANQEQAVYHNLSKLPIGYLNIGSKAATIVYNGTSASSNQYIFLKATVATQANILVF